MIKDIVWWAEIIPISTETSTLAQEWWVLFLSFFWWSRIKRKRVFWFICLFMFTKKSPCCWLSPLFCWKTCWISNRSWSGSFRLTRLSFEAKMMHQRISEQINFGCTTSRGYFWPCFLPAHQAAASEAGLRRSAALAKVCSGPTARSFLLQSQRGSLQGFSSPGSPQCSHWNQDG